MKTITKHTNKFASGIKQNQIYYCIYEGKLSKIRISKAECYTCCDERGNDSFEYEVAGIGNICSRKMPTLYKTKEEAIINKGGVTLEGGMWDVINYCKDKKLLSIECQYGIMTSHQYIRVFHWNGHKVVSHYGISPCGIKLTVDMLSGDIIIICDDGCYTNAQDCENDNTIECIEF